MISSDAHVINHNFELIFNKLNQDLIPTIQSMQKVLKKQKHTNKHMDLAVLGIGIYIYYNEKRRREQEKEMNRLREEVDKLKENE